MRNQVVTTALIGDVHGCLGPLEALVQALALAPGDHLVLIGDLLDKGPEPAGVVRYLRQLRADAPFTVTLIEGNHEDRHRRYHHNLTARPKIAREMAQAEPQLAELEAQLGAEDRAFLATAIPFLRIPDWNVLAVHGGIPGDMRRFPESPGEVAHLTGKARHDFRTILRTRYIAADDGRQLALDHERPGDPFWADVYDGRFGHVVFGHQPFFDGPACYPHATGIDTGAVHGGALTALVLPGEGEAHFVSVPGIEYRPRRRAGPPHTGHQLQLRRPE